MLKTYSLCSFSVVIGLSMSTVLTVQAQTIIGMGTDNPNPNAVLELVPENGNQGFLAPRLTTAQRTASSFTGKLTGADNGLLVFDIDQGQFYHWYKGEWRSGISTSGGGSTPIDQGTTWYTGTTTPGSINASEGDFYINESTGEVYKFSNNAFTVMGSLSGSPGSNQNLSSVLQQGSSAGNQKITQLGEPTEEDDAATKQYVDTEIANITLPNALTPGLGDVLGKDNDADNTKIIKLANPNDPQDAATKKYVDDREVATKQYVDQQIINIPVVGTDDQNLNEVLQRGKSAAGQKITNLGGPDDPQDAATKQYVDGKNRISNIAFNNGNSTLTITEDGTDHAISLSDLEDGGTPATLPRGAIYLGDNSSQPQPVTITGDITISATGEVTINDAKITTVKIATGAVNADKLAANAVTSGKVANGAVITSKIASNAVTEEKLAPLGAGRIIIGQGAGNNVAAQAISQDATLNPNGNLTVTGLQGRTISTASPGNEQVLQWDNANSEWKPATVSGGTLSLPQGQLFIGNSSSQPTPTAIGGDISIASNGTATIQGNAVSSSKIANDAVDRNKINANVAGNGLSQAGNGSLQVDLGGDVSTDTNNGTLTVEKLQGREVDATTPLADQVLMWKNSKWTPSDPSNGGGGSQQWYAGNPDPNSTNPSGSQNGDYYYRTAPTGREKVYRKEGGTWNELGGFTSTEDVQLNGNNYTYRTPWLYMNNSAPDPGAGKVGDFYYDSRPGEKKLYFKKESNLWDDF